MQIVDNLESMYYDGKLYRKRIYPGVRVYLHDEMATAEELHRMLGNVRVFEGLDDE